VLKVDSVDLEAWVEQHHREAEPRLVVTVLDEKRLELTLSEAELLSHRLADLVSQARGA
jgi:hypothetical protein